MKILLWGIPCVGHEKIGTLLAEKLNYEFIDKNDIIKKNYGTIDKYNEKYPTDYDRFKVKENIAKEIINKKDNFVMAMSFIYIKEIVKSIIDTDTISVEITDNLKSIYDRILFYDENDEVMPDSKAYRDAHKEHFVAEIKSDMTTTYREFKDIPKFKLKGRKLESVIDELAEFIVNLSNEIKN